MEVRKERSDAVVAQRANCQACGSVNDGLQTVQVATWQAGESDVVVRNRLGTRGKSGSESPHDTTGEYLVHSPLIYCVFRHSVTLPCAV